MIRICWSAKISPIVFKGESYQRESHKLTNSGHDLANDVVRNEGSVRWAEVTLDRYLSIGVRSGTQVVLRASLGISRRRGRQYEVLDLGLSIRILGYPFHYPEKRGIPDRDECDREQLY